MPKNRQIIDSYSYSTEALPVIEEFEKIVKRESRSKSYMIIEAMREYVKAHKGGNYQYALDAKGVTAYPTPWKEWTAEDVKNFTPSERAEMLKSIQQKIKLLEPKIHEKVIVPSEACAKCGKRMPYGKENHEYSHPECKAK